MTLFIKKKEDFLCEHCNFHVTGNGYTNHCPMCLWSKHVDNDPGDRAALCGGLMKPIRVEGTVKAYVLTHACIKCGHLKKNKTGNEDNTDAFLAIIAEYTNR